MNDGAATEPLLNVRDLKIAFRADGKTNEAVRGVTFHVNRGETVALVGESGSGKSVTALSSVALLPSSAQVSGSVTYEGREMVGASGQTLQDVRGNDISFIFQEPMTSLNPLHTIGKQIAESMTLHQGVSGDEARTRIIDLLTQVGIPDPETRMKSYPHQLSGGQRQRVMIAMALANDPELLVADEPTTALDVTIEAQILNLLVDLKKQKNMGMLFITHDLNIVRRLADRVCVMKDGEIVEQGPTADIFDNPKHAYTRMLLEAESTGSPLPVPSGKTTLALAIMRLISSEGRIVFMGRDIQGLRSRQLRELRRDMQMVFQDPYGSLSPRLTVEGIISEGLDVHGLEPGQDKRQLVQEMLKEVGLPNDILDRYPHEFSGGQRQRIAVARAMILKPKLLVLDEPTSALDMTVQVQIVDLLRDLQQKFGLAYLFISHDLRVVRALSHKIMVMKSGDIVEEGDAAQVFDAPKSAYTQALMAAAFEMRAIEGGSQ